MGFFNFIKPHFKSSGFSRNNGHVIVSALSGASPLAVIHGWRPSRLSRGSTATRKNSEEEEEYMFWAVRQVGNGPESLILPWKVAFSFVTDVVAVVGFVLRGGKLSLSC